MEIRHILGVNGMLKRYANHVLTPKASRQYVNTPYCSLVISYGTDKENLFDNHEVL